MSEWFGIDVSLDELVVQARKLDRTWSVPNTPQGHRRLIREIRALGCEKIVLEASGGYERKAFRALLEAGLPVVRVQPKRIKGAATALNLKAKTDQLDAGLLAWAAEKLDLPVRSLPSKEAEELRALVDLRSSLVGERDDNRRRLRQAESRTTTRVLKRLIAYLQVEIKKLDEAMRKQLERCEGRRLAPAPGKGPVLEATLVARVPELGSLGRREIAALGGVAPFNHDSGRHQGKRSIRGGRGDFRRVLYMATWAAIRKEPALRARYEALVARGKLKKVALVACMRKYLTALNAMARDGSEWNPAML